jgi:aspartate/methionine/tyrosine aminotransferase
VASIAGSSFGGNGEGYIRLSWANSDKAIEEAVARIQNMLTDSA